MLSLYEPPYVLSDSLPPSYTSSKLIRELTQSRHDVCTEIHMYKQALFLYRSDEDCDGKQSLSSRVRSWRPPSSLWSHVPRENNSNGKRALKQVFTNRGKKGRRHTEKVGCSAYPLSLSLRLRMRQQASECQG